MSKHNLYHQVETPKSASNLISQDQISPSQFIELYPEIEQTLLTSFVEDDYDGKLHFMTLNKSTSNSTIGDNTSNQDNDNNREVVGIAFWRDLDHEEMEEWMDLHRVKETLRRHADDVQTNKTSQHVQQQHTDAQTAQKQRGISFKSNSDNTLSQHGQRRMEMIRNDSLTWIRNALDSQDCTTSTEQTSNVTSNHTNKSVSTSTKVAQLTHSWIKVELLAIKQSHRHHHYSELLLASILSNASHPHAILHIAGSTSNVAARKLYERFAFVHLPRYEDGGPFEKPDGDLYVLGDVGGALERCPWDEMGLS